MKILSKTLARILGKEQEDESMENSTELIVFNQGDKYEFAECGKCGAEIDPDWDLDNDKLEPGAPYPHDCPKCGSIFTKLVRAEEV